MQAKQLAVLLVLAGIIGAWFYFDLGRYLDLQVLQAQLGSLQEWRNQNPLLASVAFFTLYVVVTAVSIPGAGIMTLAGGAIFGFWWALLLISFASAIGATLAFLVSRTLLRDWVQKKFARQLKSFNRGFEHDGSFYLFSIRLTPVFPFFLVNLLMGVLPISAFTFYWVSQLGMIPLTAVYINAGTQLAELESLNGILSPGLLASFLLVALFPLLARWAINWYQRRRVMAQYQRPQKFDTNLIVIGAGSAGLVASLIAATVKARVTLIERHRMGGDCLNTGCVPSKALIRSARVADYARRAQEFGLEKMSVQPRFADIMERVQQTIASIAPHDSVERYTGLGVDCVQGDARIVSPWEVVVGDRTISAPNIVIATGARARVPDIKGLQQLDFLTSDTLWDIRDAPSHLLVLGGGPIGCELAQAFARLGSKVTVVTHSQRLMPREDEDVAAQVALAFDQQAIAVHTGYEPVEFQRADGRQSGRFDTPDGMRELVFDRLLLAVGRSANTAGMGLEELGIEINDNGTIATDEQLRTAMPSVFACGDCVGPYQFTHMASHQAWYAAVNALFGRVRNFAVDYSIVPWATFTDPEVARVGLSEAEARAQGIEVEITRYGLTELDRAIADGEAQGFVKVLTPPGKDEILGVVIVGYHAAEMLPEFVLAMKHGLGLNKILATIHVYPTLSEANKFAAGEWRKANKPERLLGLAERYHRWRRG